MIEKTRTIPLAFGSAEVIVDDKFRYQVVVTTGDNQARTEFLPYSEHEKDMQNIIDFVFPGELTLRGAKWISRT